MKSTDVRSAMIDFSNKYANYWLARIVISLDKSDLPEWIRRELLGGRFTVSLALPLEFVVKSPSDDGWSTTIAVVRLADDGKSCFCAESKYSARMAHAWQSQSARGQKGIDNPDDLAIATCRNKIDKAIVRKEAK